MATTEYMRREALAKQSPLLITKDFDYSNIPTEKVEYQRIDGTWSKVQLYSSDFSSCKNILACYEHFHDEVPLYYNKGYCAALVCADTLASSL